MEGMTRPSTFSQLWECIQSLPHQDDNLYTESKHFNNDPRHRLMPDHSYDTDFRCHRCRLECIAESFMKDFMKPQPELTTKP